MFAHLRGVVGGELVFDAKDLIDVFGDCFEVVSDEENGLFSSEGFEGFKESFF